ncbi:hypothetical protein BP6252_02764 [Coleophoma cylindrospora]|uniref:Heme haloperoxidase family profile domain-containing protein n=1 Tax=Coleophoma cylindrospora TaxID=1849047 RepID=A0A3D8SG99_9HELO|nr:hypothetical protein BP6252_02764 [Coleophoma cylindrospora]
MKTSSLVCLLAFAITEVSAFPSIALDAAKIEALTKQSTSITKKAIGFDPVAQYVSTTGSHQFVPPNFAAGDQRGPCPGLNAAANHGYIPHNGVGTMGQIIDGVNTAFGMALDLGAFLAIYGAVFDGNLLGYSIGGPTTASQLPLSNTLGLTGAPQGLSGSHNKYESDVSPTRGDLYLYGNDYTVQVAQFKQYYEALPDGLSASAQYDALAPFHNARFQDSKNRNPNFFYSPFSGILVSPAGYNFPVRMMSNKSAEFPEGSLDKETFKSFFAITGNYPNFKYHMGYERIPDNWYKRAIGDEYTIPGFLADVLNHVEKYPELASIGGNVGKVNTFAPVDITALTKGVFSSANLLKGNNLECFVLQSAEAALPDIAIGTLGNLLGTVTSATKPFSDAVASRLAGLGCPKLASLDKNQFNKYPGYANCKDGCSHY